MAKRKLGRVLDRMARKAEPLKSGPSHQRAYLRFVNRSQRLVDILWLDYLGISKKFRTLRPTEFVDVNTFAGHPWAFHDSLTGSKLVAQGKEIYSPNFPGENEQITRKVINITIPVYTLQECCIQFITTCMSTSDMDALNIPVVLIRELQDFKDQHTSKRPLS